MRKLAFGLFAFSFFGCLIWDSIALSQTSRETIEKRKMESYIEKGSGDFSFTDNLDVTGTITGSGIVKSSTSFDGSKLKNETTDGDLSLCVADGGVEKCTLNLDGDTGDILGNDAGNDTDFYYESDTNANFLRIDAGAASGKGGLAVGGFVPDSFIDAPMNIRTTTDHTYVLNLWRSGAAAGWALNVTNDASGIIEIHKVGEGTTGLKMSIENGGDMNLGSSTIGSHDFNLNGDTSSILGIVYQEAGTSKWDVHIDNTETDQSYQIERLFNTNRTASLAGTGAFSAWSFSSDRKLKKDIAPFTNGLSVVKSLKVRKYKWKESEENAVGFIAQEFDDILPNLVTQDDDDYLMIEGSGGLIPYLTRAIQEQQALIESQKNEIDLMKGWICSQELPPLKLCK